MLKPKKKNLNYFSVPIKKLKQVRGGHFEFHFKTLKMLPAHLHVVGNVIVKFE